MQSPHKQKTNVKHPTPLDKFLNMPLTRLVRLLVHRVVYSCLPANYLALLYDEIGLLMYMLVGLNGQMYSTNIKYAVRLREVVYLKFY